MKIQLMDVSETQELMDLWKNEMIKLTGMEDEINLFFPVVEETLGHSNIYLVKEDNKINSFATVLEGFYISDLFYLNEEAGRALINDLKTRYDELQIDLHHKHPANLLLPSLDFTKLGRSEHDVLTFDEIQYEWLGE